MNPRAIPTRLPNEHYRNREHLFIAEIEHLLETAKSKSRNPDRDYALILMMFRHGLRAVEAAMLEWKDIDLFAKTIYIKRVKKSNSGVHPLQDDEVSTLRVIEQRQIPQVFINERKTSFLYSAKQGVTSTAPGISGIIERLGQASNLTIKVHAHMLRHSCGYWLTNQGLDTRLIQDYLGHKNIQHTVRYTQLNPNRFKQIDWNPAILNSQY